MKNVIYIYYQNETFNTIPKKMIEHGYYPKLIINGYPSKHKRFDELYDIEGISNYVLDVQKLRGVNTTFDIPIIKEYLSKSIKMPKHVEDKLFEKFPMFLDQFQKYDYYHNWSYLDYLNYYFMIARFAYNFMVSENIYAIMHAYFCHVGIDLIFCTVAEALGIKTLFFHPEYEIETGRFLALYSTSMDFDKIYSSMTKKRRDCNLTVKKSFKRDLTYMKNIKYFGLENLKYKLSMFFKMIIYMFLPESNKKRTKYFNRIKKLMQDRTCIRKRDSIIKPVDFSKKYVYFGLHMQPEATTSFFGGKYSDQLLAIEKLSEIIPDDWYIYVKENPKQNAENRGKSFYVRLDNIPKAQLVPMDTNNYKLMEHSQFVSSITGTMLYEAVCGNKPALMFGHYWYSKLPGVTQYREDLTVDDIMNCEINHDEIQKIANDHYSKCVDIIIEDDMFKLLLPEQVFDKEENERKAMEILLELLENN